jgi:hypothetical protein
MINRESSKYVNLFINKTFNNFLWRSVIYDFDCNDSFIYNLNRFVNEITFTHEMINTSNDFMLIKEYKIMLVINRINEKNRRMFFDNMIYVSFIDVILMFVIRLKKQDFVYVRVLPFYPDYRSTRLNSIREESASISHKSLFCTIDFLLFFSKSIFSVININ